MECELRFPSTGNFESIWLRRLALPALVERGLSAQLAMQSLLHHGPPGVQAFLRRGATEPETEAA